MKLYKFQEEYLRGLPSKYIFAADTGTGKTAMSLAQYDKLDSSNPVVFMRDFLNYLSSKITPEPDEPVA